MELTSKILAKNQIFDIIQDLRSQKKVSVFGLNLGERVFLSHQYDDFICYVTDTSENADAVAKDLVSLGRKVAVLTDANDDYTYHIMEFGNSGINLQANLNNIVFGKVNACVVTADMLCMHFAPKEMFLSSALEIKVGDTRDRSEILTQLISRGYTRVDAVESAGQCAMRGDVLDIFPINSELPYRLHFFDTEIEKITTFNILTQYSIKPENEVFVCPNAFLIDEAEMDALKTKLRGQYDSNRPKMAKAKNPDEFLGAIGVLNTLAETLRDSIPRNAWGYLSAFLPTANLIDLLPKNSLVVIDQPKQCGTLVDEYIDRVSRNIAEGIQNGQLVPLHKNLTHSFASVIKQISSQTAISFQSIMTQNRFFDPARVVSMQTLPVPKLGDSYEGFSTELQHFVEENYTIIIATSEPASAEECYTKMQKFLPVEKISRSVDAVAGRVNILVDSLYLGACFVADKLLLLGGAESRFVRKKDKTWQKQMVKVTDRFTLPEIGEYVVHATHGIGVCEGVTQLNIGHAKRDYVVVSYKNNDKVYVPTEQMDMLGRYIGGDKAPTLSTIGTNTFEKAKQRVRESVKELAFDLLALYREREKSVGNVMKVDDSTMAEFEASFKYTPTPDQESAFEDVYRDLASGKIMDRLVVGDVGFGKTEVAIRASFVAVMSGYQVAVIVPTTILSEQHYNNFSARLKNYGIEVRCLNRFKSPKEQKQIIADVKSGKVNILIGTHRVLSQDVEFDNLGLLVLDEEQRFGVGDKEKLKNAKKNVHVLTLTATPIPRTLHISLVGIRDISTIETPPLDRLPVQTVVSQFSYSLISTAINRELSRGGQSLVVYPTIDNIDTFAQSLSAELGQNVRIGVAHGRMEKSRIEDTILALYQGEIDVLVATTLIENGIDLPNANTLFVVSADKLGLSQLYQLRGRVGRSDKLAWAYFTYMDEGKLNNIAYERLSVLMQFTALGSGFKIAMRDLELRGAGNILGPEQHGQMEKVGYDMYCKLLDSSIALAKGEPKQEFRPVKIEVDIDAFVPDNFETDKIKRMEIYSAIANIQNSADAENVTLQIKDQYGYLPKPIDGLIRVATLKAKCQVLGIERVSVTRAKSSIYVGLDKVDLLNRIQALSLPKFMVYKKDTLVIISYDNQGLDEMQAWDNIFDYLDKLLIKVG